MRMLRHILAGLTLLSLSAMPIAAYENVTMPQVWNGLFGPSTCIGSLCVIIPGPTNNFWELSYREYQRPTP